MINFSSKIHWSDTLCLALQKINESLPSMIELITKIR